MAPRPMSTIILQGSTFHRFPDLPIEIQLYIWELAISDSSETYIRIDWISPHITTSWPLASIPQLGARDPPGLIPYVLPKGMPATLLSHPPPRGIPDPQHPQDADLSSYLQNARSSDRGILEAISSFGLSSTDVARVVKQRGGARSRPGMLAACFVTCRASRVQALRHTIRGTHKPLLCPNTHNTGGNRVYPVLNGFVFGNIFVDSRSGRPCLVHALAPNMSSRKAAPRIGKDFRPGDHTHMAARLSDIERCIFGRRLSLTKLPKSANKNWYVTLSWMIWWRPELGHRARRPEANHPWYMPPATIMHIYSMILHHLVGARTKDYPGLSACLYEKVPALYYDGEWYTTLVREGICNQCRMPLMDDLRTNFPELLDSKGCIDIIVVRDRKSIEEPELTSKLRSHEY